MSDKTETTTPDTTSPKIRAAFVIAIGEDGSVYLERDTEAVSIPVEREATMLEVRRYTSEVLMDLQAQASAEYTAARVLAMQQASAAHPAAK